MSSQIWQAYLSRGQKWHNLWIPSIEKYDTNFIHFCSVFCSAFCPKHVNSWCFFYSHFPIKRPPFIYKTTTPLAQNHDRFLVKKCSKTVKNRCQKLWQVFEKNREVFDQKVTKTDPKTNVCVYNLGDDLRPNSSRTGVRNGSKPWQVSRQKVFKNNPPNSENRPQNSTQTWPEVLEGSSYPQTSVSDKAQVK